MYTQLFVQSEMHRNISRWLDMYRGSASWQSEKVPSAFMAATVSAEIARLACVDLDISLPETLSDSVSAPVISLLPLLREKIELGCACGGLIFKPNGKGIDCIPQSDFIPVAFDRNGEISSIIFRLDSEETPLGIATLFERHDYADGKCTVTHTVSVSSDSGEEKELPLAVVPRWASLEEKVVLDNVDRHLFGYFRFPSANHVDHTSPMGVSAFSKAEGNLRDIDSICASLRWEIDSAERKVFISESAFEHDSGGNIINPFPRLFKGLEFGVDGDSVIHEFNPEIRIEKYRTALETALGFLSVTCGFSVGHFGFEQGYKVMTATQVEYDMGRTTSLVTDVQNAIRTAIDGLVSALCCMNGISTTPSVSYYFRDVAVNAEEERLRILSLVEKGILPAWKYLVDYEGYSEESAKKLAAEAGKEKATVA